MKGFSIHIRTPADELYATERNCRRDGKRNPELKLRWIKRIRVREREKGKASRICDILCYCANGMHSITHTHSVCAQETQKYFLNLCNSILVGYMYTSKSMDIPLKYSLLPSNNRTNKKEMKTALKTIFNEISRKTRRFYRQPD